MKRIFSLTILALVSYLAYSQSPSYTSGTAISSGVTTTRLTYDTKQSILGINAFNILGLFQQSNYFSSYYVYPYAAGLAPSTSWKYSNNAFAGFGETEPIQDPSEISYTRCGARINALDSMYNVSELSFPNMFNGDSYYLLANSQYGGVQMEGTMYGKYNTYFGDGGGINKESVNDANYYVTNEYLINYGSTTKKLELYNNNVTTSNYGNSISYNPYLGQKVSIRNYNKFSDVGNTDTIYLFSSFMHLDKKYYMDKYFTLLGGFDNYKIIDSNIANGGAMNRHEPITISNKIDVSTYTYKYNDRFKAYDADCTAVQFMVKDATYNVITPSNIFATTISKYDLSTPLLYKVGVTSSTSYVSKDTSLYDVSKTKFITKINLKYTGTLEAFPSNRANVRTASNSKQIVAITLPIVITNRKSKYALYPSTGNENVVKIYVRAYNNYKTGSFYKTHDPKRIVQNTRVFSVTIPRVTVSGTTLNTPLPQSMANTQIQMDENNFIYAFIGRALYKMDMNVNASDDNAYGNTVAATKIVDNVIASSMILDRVNNRLFFLGQLNPTSYERYNGMYDTICRAYSVDLSTYKVSEEKSFYVTIAGKRYCPTTGLALDTRTNTILALGKQTYTAVNLKYFDGLNFQNNTLTSTIVKANIAPSILYRYSYNCSTTNNYVITAIDQVNMETKEVIAYPNPNTGSFKVSSEEIDNVIVYDMNGNSRTYYTNEINTDLKGLLIVKVSDKSGATTTIKVVAE